MERETAVQRRLCKEMCDAQGRLASRSFEKNQISEEKKKFSFRYTYVHILKEYELDSYKLKYSRQTQALRKAIGLFPTLTLRVGSTRLFLVVERRQRLGCGLGWLRCITFEPPEIFNRFLPSTLQIRIYECFNFISCIFKVNSNKNRV
jgi:hypothetical protein